MEVALIVLDGWGIGPDDDPSRRNAVTTADTPTVDALSKVGAAGRLTVSGRDVGLPEGQMGNSEVGHLNIGAGRIVYHPYTRINDAIGASELNAMDGSDDRLDEDPLDQNSAILGAFEHANTHGGRVHVLGLVSDGGVHADLHHLFALIELAASLGVDAVTHAFLDGRDSAPTSGSAFIQSLEEQIATHDTGQIATVTGRYFAMDRDQNWERTFRAYEAIVRGDAAFDSATPIAAVENAYDRGETDEFVAPTTVDGGVPVTDRDAMLFVNFRADRARQLVRMLGDIEPAEWTEHGIQTKPPAVPITTMTEYDRTFPFPVAFEPHRPEQTLGSVWEQEGYRQLRIAESEKYAHVTYFLNGGREVQFEGEIRRIIDSPDVPTYDLQPEMHATRVTDEAIETILTTDPDALVLNYANPDMVGHTGDFEATVTAVETVDEELGRLVNELQEARAHTIVTADHGNADNMGSPEAPHTAHTPNDVPFIYLAPDGTDGHRRVTRIGRLADIAPTMLDLMDIEQPSVMTGSSLLSGPADRQGNS